MHKHNLAYLLCGIMATVPTVLLAQVKATVSSASIAENEPLTVTYESDAAAASPPNLSPLEQDFHILNRRSSRSVRSFNGRTTQKTSVIVTLMPKRSGDLVIPPITFGQDHSQPLQVSVTPVADSSGISGFPPNQGFSSMGPAIPPPFAPPQQGYSPGYSLTPPSMAGQDWAGMDGFPGWGGTGFGIPDWTGAPAAQGWMAQPEPSAVPVPDEPDTDYWPWIAGILVGSGIVLITLTLCRRTRCAGEARKQPEPPATLPDEPAPQDPEEYLAAVRQAYQNEEAYAAKEALLHWAAIEWPGNPPTNLSRLAARCPAPLQQRILKLDEALYSPKPIAWSGEPVVEQLRELARNQPDHPPSETLAPSSSS
jgi:hypothetical protein